MSWLPLHFVDQNKNSVKSKIQCLTIGAHLSERVIGVTKINIASLILQSTKNFKTF